MKKRMIKLMTIFCMAGILTVNPVITGLAEGMDAVGADVPEEVEESEEEPVAEETEEPEEADEETDEEVTEEEPETEEEKEAETVESKTEADVQRQRGNDVAVYVENCVDTIEFIYNNGNNTVTSKSNDSNYKVGYDCPLETIETANMREGYDFIGWYKDNGDKGKELLSGNTYKITAEDVQNNKIIVIRVF